MDLWIYSHLGFFFFLGEKDGGLLQTGGNDSIRVRGRGGLKPNKGVELLCEFEAAVRGLEGLGLCSW